MNRTLIATLLAASALTAGAASAQDAGWYVRGDVGAAFEGEIDATPKQETDTGFAISGGVGRHLNDSVRLEGELAYLDGDVSGSAGGDAQILAGFANAYYDFNPGGQWRPFVGAGLGFGQVKVDSPLIDDEDTGFAYQLKAGVGYRFDERLTGEVAYRYLGVTDIELGSGPTKIDGDVSTHAVTVGLRYQLGR
ncbi:MAG: outer membrane protein [Phenylobacterium sp.]|uniref:outer membrane protein n=1 Tax=Phenylobacterium sp. TaxID=1871053 RepID=UPI00391AE2B5